MKPVAMVGTGNGACAMSAGLTLRGFQVHLCSVHSPKRIEEIKSHGGIELSGAAGEGLVRPKLMTSNIEEAIKDVDLIFWPIPANGHEFHVRKFAPYLKPGHILILLSGAVGGSLVMTNLLNQLKVKGVLVGETCSLPYGCRLTGPFSVKVQIMGKKVLLAMLPDLETDRVLKLIKPLFPNLIKGETVLEISLNTLNLLLHPPGMILNAGWIEHRKGDFAFYHDGISPSVARIIEELDNERLNIIRALNLKPISFVEWYFRREMSQNRDSVYDAVHSSNIVRNVRAPESLNHRFILEDVPFALVPLSHFGRLVGVATPITDALILLASRMCCKDFLKEGTDLKKMGISGMSISQLKQFVTEGRLS